MSSVPLDLTAVFTGIGAAAAVGIVQATVGPVMKWYIDKKKRSRERREQLVQSWRDMIRDTWRQIRLQCELAEAVRTQKEGIKERMDEQYDELDDVTAPIDVLRSDHRYYRLRSRMSRDAVQEIEETDEVAMPPDPSLKFSLPPVLETVAEEVEKIEAEWELVA